MTRGLSAGMVTEAQAASGEGVHLFELQFSGGTQYYTTASSDISWNGNTWTALGGHLGFDTVQETTDLRAQGVRLTLDGVNTSIISTLLSQAYIGRRAIIRLLKFDSSGAIVADPETIFDGLLNNKFEITETEGTAKIKTFVVSSLARFNQKRGIRASVISHQSHFSGDTFWRHLTAIRKNIFWGRDIPATHPPGQGRDASGGTSGGRTTHD